MPIAPVSADAEQSAESNANTLPIACQRDEVSAFDESEIDDTLLARQDAIEAGKQPLIVSPIVITRGAGEIETRFIDNRFQPVGEDVPIDQVWGVVADVPLGVLAEDNVKISIFVDILAAAQRRFPDHAANLEIILPIWFPKDLVDAVIYDQVLVPRLLTRSLVDGVCLQALVDRGWDTLAVKLIGTARNSDWALMLTRIYLEQQATQRTPSARDRYLPEWRVFNYFSQLWDFGREAPIDTWLASDDPTMRAAAVITLGDRFWYSEDSDEEKREVLNRILPYLDDDDPVVRREAAIAAARLAYAIRARFDRLGVRFQTERSLMSAIDAWLHSELLAGNRVDSYFIASFARDAARTLPIFRPMIAAVGGRLSRQEVEKIVDAYPKAIREGGLALTPDMREFLLDFALRGFGFDSAADLLEESDLRNSSDRVFFFAAKRDEARTRAALIDAGEAFHDELRAEHPDRRLEAGKIVIRLGFEELMPVLADVIATSTGGDGYLAKLAANSGHAELARAANRWAGKRGLIFTEMPGLGGSVTWGNF